jgi:hypothetical protein
MAVMVDAAAVGAAGDATAGRTGVEEHENTMRALTALTLSRGERGF